MTDAELLKGLRSGIVSKWTAEAAADRIEMLVKERKAMAMRDAGYDVYADLETKLAKAVEALTPFALIDGCCSAEMDDDYSPGWAEFFKIGDFRKARAALTELEKKE